MIQFITRSNSNQDKIADAKKALENGCKWIQLRMKPEVSDEEFVKVATEIRQLCNEHHAYFIVADRVNLVKEVKADGVFLANGDMSVEEARSILGNRYIISGKAHNIEEIKQLYQEGADSIGVGIHHVRDFNSPENSWKQSFEELSNKMKEENISSTLFAYGDISPEELASLKESGVREIAINSKDINKNEAPESTISEYVNGWHAKS